MQKDFKLRDSAEYQKVFKQNKSLRHKYWLILYRPNEKASARLGTAISKKNVRKAVQRNRLKRIIKETFRQNRKTLGSVDIVVLARPGVCEKSNRELNATITKQWKKLAKESPVKINEQADR